MSKSSYLAKGEKGEKGENEKSNTSKLDDESISKCKNLDDISKDEFVKILDNLCAGYHNGISDITDEKYDSIKEFYEKKFREEYTKVGAPPLTGSQEKKNLPKYMGSLNKITDVKSLDNWKKKNPGPYIITDKIDGISCLQRGNNLYTRGDGTIGTDISHLASSLHIPKDIGEEMVRMEIVMPKDIFEEKYSKDAANARNMVSGLVNRKNFDQKSVQDLLVIAYEYDNKTEMKQSDQLSKLENIGYKLPYSEVVGNEDDLTIEYLGDLLKRRKEDANYDIDGMVVFRDISYLPVVGENPKNAFAFKMEGECVSTIVEEVEWNISKHGLIKPRVRIFPVQLCGVTITWCTGFNAKFIIDNNISKGCTIEVTRRGDVIPYIKDVTIPGDHPDMPEQEYEWAKKKYMVLEHELVQHGKNKNNLDIEIHGDEKYYVWYSESDVDICIKGENDDMKVKKLVSFFKKLEAKFVGESSLQKLYNSGYTTLHDILDLTVDDICEIEGFQKKSASRIVEAIRTAITDVPLAKIAAASGVMGVGIGEKKIQLVVDKHPDILQIDIPLSEMTDLIKDVGGFNTLSVHFASKLSCLRKFFIDHPQITLKKEKVRKNKENKHNKENKQNKENKENKQNKENKENIEKEVPIIFNDDEIVIEEENKEDEHSLKGKTVVFTGFRNKDAEEKIKDLGGKVTTTVSGKTNLLVVANRYSGNSKEIKADRLGIEVITVQEFIDRYM